MTRHLLSTGKQRNLHTLPLVCLTFCGKRINKGGIEGGKDDNCIFMDTSVNYLQQDAEVDTSPVKFNKMYKIPVAAVVPKYLQQK